MVLVGLWGVEDVSATDISACQALSANTSYNLTSNVTAANNSNCFTTSGNNITLECNDYTILGNGTGYGIYESKDNIYVYNCIFENWTGTFTTTCTATDDTGNSGSSSISYTVSSSGGGGGTSSFYINTIVQDNKEFSEIETITKELKKKERLRIQIDSEEHYVGVAELTNTTATIEISSTSQKTVFNIGDENKFEVSNDNYYDIYVKLNSIANNKANLTIKSIYEEIPAEKEEVNKGVAEKEPEDEIDKRKSNWNRVIIALIILIFIVIITARHRLKR